MQPRKRARAFYPGEEGQGQDISGAIIRAAAELRAAISTGDDDRVRRMLAVSYPIMGSLLHAAVVDAGNVAYRGVLEGAIASGADLDPADHRGRTPLMDAISCGNIDAARVLLAGGADLNTPCRDGWTPLTHAVGTESADQVRLLLQHGADDMIMYRNVTEEPWPRLLSLRHLLDNPPPVIVSWRPVEHRRFRAPFHRQTVTWMCIATQRAGIPRYVAMMVLPWLAAAYVQDAPEK